MIRFMTSPCLWNWWRTCYLAVANRTALRHANSRPPSSFTQVAMLGSVVRNVLGNRLGVVESLRIRSLRRMRKFETEHFLQPEAAVLLDELPDLLRQIAVGVVREFSPPSVPGYLRVALRRRACTLRPIGCGWRARGCRGGRSCGCRSRNRGGSGCRGGRCWGWCR